MKPVEILKQGLKKLQDQTYSRKAVLEAALKARQPISEVDEEWLDNAGNLVDEEQVVDKLDKALDFDSALKQLNERDKVIVQKLQELAGHNSSNGSDAPTKKRKRMIFK